jgi:hypothetical protein
MAFLVISISDHLSIEGKVQEDLVEGVLWDALRTGMDTRGIALWERKNIRHFGNVQERSNERGFARVGAGKQINK